MKKYFLILILLGLTFAQRNNQNDYLYQKFGTQIIENNGYTMLKINYGRELTQNLSFTISGVYDIKRKNNFNHYGGSIELDYKYYNQKLFGDFIPYIDTEVSYLRGVQDSQIKTTSNILNLYLSLGFLYELVISNNISIIPRIELANFGAWKTETVEGMTDSTFGNTKSTPDFATSIGLGVSSYWKVSRNSKLFFDIRVAGFDNFGRYNFELSYLTRI